MRILAEAAALPAVLIAVVAARLGGKFYRKVNRFGIAAWTILVLLALLVPILAVELIELV